MVKAVAPCWNVGALPADVRATSVEVFFSMNGNIPIASSIRMGGHWGGSDAAARRMFESVRRAIIRCGAMGMELTVSANGELTAVFASPN